MTIWFYAMTANRLLLILQWALKCVLMIRSQSEKTHNVLLLEVKKQTLVVDIVLLIHVNKTLIIPCIAEGPVCLF